MTDLTPAQLQEIAAVSAVVLFGFGGLVLAMVAIVCTFTAAPPPPWPK